MPFLPFTPVSGVNFGGWLSQSDLSPERLEGFITEADFHFVKACGFNTVRLPFNAKLVWGQGQLLPSGMVWLDQAVAWSKAAGLRLILDLHEVPGASFVVMAANGLYQDKAQQRDAAGLWGALAAHYSREGDQLLFELLNEPVAPTAEAWGALAGKLLSAIRDVDERRPVVMGSNLWSMAAEFARLEPLDDPRVLYTFHFYDPVHISHQGAPWVPWACQLPAQPYPGPASGMDAILGRGDAQAEAQAAHLAGHWDADRLEALLAPVIAFRDQHRVPVFCGEFGVYLKAGREDQLRWMDDFTGLLVKHGFGFTYWNYRGMDFGLFYEEAKWGHLPQYQNGRKLDGELLELLKRRAAELVKGGEA